MEKIVHVPAGKFAVLCDLTHAVLVALAKKLHAYDGEDEDNDGQHQSQVPQSTHRVSNDFDQHVERGPGFSQLKDSQLSPAKPEKKTITHTHTQFNVSKNVLHRNIFVPQGTFIYKVNQVYKSGP